MSVYGPMMVSICVALRQIRYDYGNSAYRETIVACIPPASQEHIAYTCTIFFPRQGQSMNNSSRHVQLLYILLKLSPG